MFSIPNIRECNLTRCTRGLPCNNNEIIKFFYAKSINLNIAKQFEKRWNFPHCFEAVEGKHIAIHKHDSSSLYLNYKSTHSILSLAVAGPDYECLLTDFDVSCDDGVI